MEFKFKDHDNANLARLLFNLKDERIYNTQIQSFYEQRKNSHPNPFCKYGSKVFSQTDEDGITFEIVRRIKIAPTIATTPPNLSGIERKMA